MLANEKMLLCFNVILVFQITFVVQTTGTYIIEHTPIIIFLGIFIFNLVPKGYLNHSNQVRIIIAFLMKENVPEFRNQINILNASLIYYTLIPMLSAYLQIRLNLIISLYLLCCKQYMIACSKLCFSV